MSENNDKLDSIYNTKSLYLLNIKELRSIGRQLGVPSPASKSKGELVDYILKIIYGEIEAPARNNFGRPSKNEYNIDDCLDKIKKSSLEVISNKNTLDKIKINNYRYEDDFKDLSFKLVSSNSEKYDLEDNIETRIYCKVDGKHYLKKKVFVKSDDDIEISESFVSRYNIDGMDIVEVIRYKEYFKIYSINGVKVVNNKAITIGDSVINWGRSQDFYLSTKEEIKQKINHIIDWSKNEDVFLAIFSDDIYVGSNIYCMYHKHDAVNTQIYKKLMLFLDKCENLALSGENIIIVFEDKYKIESIIKSFDNDIYLRLKKHLNEVLENIVNIGNICINFKEKRDIKY